MQNKNDKNKKEKDLKNLENYYNKQKEKYKNEIKNIKANIELKLQKEYENKIKNKIQNLNMEINKKNKNIENELQQKLLQRYQNTELEFQRKFMELSNITKAKIIQMNEENNKLKKDLCNTIHYNIACQKCSKNPIIGIRYKCSICKDFNLCANCEEENSVSLAHPHNFIKIRNATNNEIILYNNNNNKNNNNIYINNNNNKNNTYNNIFKGKENKNEWELIENNNMYSYECLVNKLNCYILEGVNKAVLSIILKNNGKMPWVKYRTLLKFDKNNSDIKGADIILKPQEPGQQSNYDINFNGLKNVKAGKYKASFNFMVNGKKYGSDLIIFVIIKEKKEKEEEEKKNNNNINNKKEEIKKFREEYGISSLEYPDEKIIELLEKYNYDFDSTFSGLFK